MSPRIFLPGLALAVLAACDAPAPGMGGLPPRVIEVEGSRFSIYIANGRAEAIRTNMEYRNGIMARGYRAIEQASGCQIVPGSFGGDPARMTAELACPGG